MTKALLISSLLSLTFASECLVQSIGYGYALDLHGGSLKVIKK